MTSNYEQHSTSDKHETSKDDKDNLGRDDEQDKGSNFPVTLEDDPVPDLPTQPVQR